MLFIATIFFGYSGYIAILVAGIFLWKTLETNLKLEDDSIYYIIALVFCGSVITIANLSFDEIKVVINNITFEEYFWTKLVSNLCGLTLFPLIVAKLVNINQKKVNIK
ncbi:TPA: hypothetical protein RNX40_001728 [Pasteurella multocida]|nr:hypothetical protein [Pasteurella multocida]